MLRTEKSTNIIGRSIITNANGVDEVVVYMNASISENGAYPSISTSIQNRELYIANKVKCKEDMNEFEDKVDSLIEE